MMCLYVLCHFLYVRGSFFVHFCGVGTCAAHFLFIFVGLWKVCVGIDVVVVDGGAFSWRSLNVQHSKIYQLCSVTWKHGSHVHTRIVDLLARGAAARGAADRGAAARDAANCALFTVEVVECRPQRGFAVSPACHEFVEL